MDTIYDSKWGLGTRIIHWGLATTISAQLLSGLLVADPQTRMFFYFHEWDGVAASFFILMMWLWGYATQDLSILFPWDREGMRTVRDDIRNLFRGVLPKGGNTPGFASFGHGLGLLAITGMALTGIWILFIIPGGHGVSGGSTDFQEFMDISWFHKTIAYFVWAYLIGHIGFAVLHRLKGAPIFRGIFLGP